VVYKRRPLPITILAVIDGVLGSASTVLALYTATYLAGNPNPPQPENLLAALGVAAIGAFIAIILIGVIVLGSLIGLALLLKALLLWRGDKKGYWLSIAAITVSGALALTIHPLVIYALANILALLPKSRKYLLWEEPPVETYELAVNHT